MRKLAWVALGAGVAVAGLLACSSDDAASSSGGGTTDPPQRTKDGGFDSRPDPDSGLGVLSFLPEQSYSGYDGQHTFKVPVAVYDSADDLEVTATDPSAVTITPATLKNPVSPDGIVDNGKYFLVTVKKAGAITLTATSKGRSAQAKITVASYTTAQYAAGQTRYENGAGADPPCTDCHVNGDAIDHSPAALATATDEKIGVVITTGISTAGFPIMIDNKPGHKWTVTDDERAGLVSYLRGIEPRGFK